MVGLIIGVCVCRCISLELWIFLGLGLIVLDAFDCRGFYLVGFLCWLPGVVLLCFTGLICWWSFRELVGCLGLCVLVR